MQLPGNQKVDYDYGKFVEMEDGRENMILQLSKECHSKCSGYSEIERLGAYDTRCSLSATGKVDEQVKFKHLSAVWTPSKLLPASAPQRHAPPTPTSLLLLSGHIASPPLSCHQATEKPCSSVHSMMVAAAGHPGCPAHVHVLVRSIFFETALADDSLVDCSSYTPYPRCRRVS